MSNPYEQVKNILLQHRGRDKAIKGKEIAHFLGFRDDRQIRLVIRELITEGYPIASSVQSPYGYFLIESLEEAREYQQLLRDRLIEIALRRRDFKKGAGKKLDMVKQGSLF